MDLPADDVETIAVSAFKPRSLELIERVASGRVARIVLTKRGRAVAALVPGASSRGAEGDVARVDRAGRGSDLTAPAGEAWAAERG